MDSSQIFNLLDDLRRKAEAAFSSWDILILAEIRDRLLEIESDDRVHFETFVNDFTNKLFRSGIGLPGESLENYQIVPSKNLKIKTVRQKKNNFEETFKSVIKCLKNELETAKNYYFITLNYDDSQNYNLLILSDNNYFVIPYKNCLQKQFENITVSTIEEFGKDLIKKASVEEGFENYICLLLLRSKMNALSDIKTCNKNLKEIIKLFNSSESISLRSFNTNESFYLRKTLAEKDFLDEDFFDELEYLTYTFLTNTELLYEEEKLIKLFFKDYDCPLLEYKLIERGNSGAKVIEIRPKQKINSSQARRFIVKYRLLSESRKLNEEAKNFNRYLGGFEGFSEYTCTHKKTSTHEGILYNYAKSDHEDFSFPFSTILDNPENEFHKAAPEKIDKLFNIEEFNLWGKDKDTKTDLIKELYKPFIKPDIEDEIQKILDLKRNELEELDLIQNYEKIINHEITIKAKVCHGDLHTNNFFVDKQNIYLIDFGFTQFHPPVIDHAFLEASIKFNHIPRFIDIESLKKIEDELLKEETFSAGFKFSCSKRKDLNYFLNIIHRIRVNSNSLLHQENKLEYLITLFIVTFKLIKYSDLNQLYALNSATILSKKIVKELGL